MLKLALLILPFMAAGTVMAQSNPTVEIVLSQPTAQQGNTVTANVTIHNPVNLAGADIGITTDETCLKIVDRKQGSLLPDSSSGGAFSPFSELKDHETRLAVALTDRTKIANSDGVFYSAGLEVTCAQGIAPVTISFGELSSYKDPSAANVELIANRITDNTLNVVNAQLAIGPAGQVTAVPTQPLPTSAATPVQPQATPTLAPVTTAPSEPPLLPAIAIIIAVTVVVFIVLVIVSRRRSDDE